MDSVATMPPKERADLFVAAAGKYAQRVIEHNKVFFRSTWAHYETAVPGSFRLVPQKDRLSALRSDYAQMKAMIFGEYPKWDDIVEGLKGLEERINK